MSMDQDAVAEEVEAGAAVRLAHDFPGAGAHAFGAAGCTRAGVGGVLMCSLLMRSAGQERSEQGDIWHKVSQLRPLPLGTPSERLRFKLGWMKGQWLPATAPVFLFGP